MSLGRGDGVKAAGRQVPQGTWTGPTRSAAPPYLVPAGRMPNTSFLSCVKPNRNPACPFSNNKQKTREPSARLPRPEVFVPWSPTQATARRRPRVPTARRAGQQRGAELTVTHESSRPARSPDSAPQTARRTPLGAADAAVRCDSRAGLAPRPSRGRQRGPRVPQKPLFFPVRSEHRPDSSQQCF